MEPTPTSLCTENVHAELIDGRYYDIAPPSIEGILKLEEER